METQEETKHEIQYWSYIEFRDAIMELVTRCPKMWRKGQAVFNIIDANYDVAREVQFEDGVDCFYDDSQIEPFLALCWAKIAPTLEEWKQHNKNTNNKTSES